MALVLHGADHHGNPCQYQKQQQADAQCKPCHNLDNPLAQGPLHFAAYELTVVAHVGRKQFRFQQQCLEQGIDHDDAFY